MSELVDDTSASLARPGSPWPTLLRTEDWWAILIGVGLILVALGALAAGGSIKWLAVAPQKWSHLSDIAPQLEAHALQYVQVFAGFWTDLGR